MLAVKLHKRKSPYLGKGSFLVPIRTWRSGKIHVRNWHALIKRANRGAPNDCVRYITLVKIPDDHPVFIGLDWIVKRLIGVDYIALSEIDDDIKANLDLVPPGETGPIEMQNYIVPDPVAGAPIAEYPELILGKPLPARCVKWTKDIRLLYGKEKPRKVPRNSAGEPRTDPREE